MHHELQQRKLVIDRIKAELMDWHLNRFMTSMFGPNWKEEPMTKMGCYGCETGTVNHHQDGARSWFQCECGKYTGPKIDMSDTHHVREALNGWNAQAVVFAEAKILADAEALKTMALKQDVDQTAPPSQESGTGEPNPVDQAQQGQNQPPEPPVIASEPDKVPTVASGGVVDAGDGIGAVGSVDSAGVVVDGEGQDPYPTLPDDVSDVSVDPGASDAPVLPAEPEDERRQDPSPDAPLDDTQDTSP